MTVNNFSMIFLAPSQKTSAGPPCVNVEVNVGKIIDFNNSEVFQPAFYCGSIQLTRLKLCHL